MCPAALPFATFCTVASKLPVARPTFPDLDDPFLHQIPRSIPLSPCTFALHLRRPKFIKPCVVQQLGVREAILLDLQNLQQLLEEHQKTTQYG